MTYKYMRLFVWMILLLTSFIAFSLNRDIDAQDVTPGALAAGTIAKDFAGFEMVYVPSGTFEMGVSVDEYRHLYQELINDEPSELGISIAGEVGIFDTYTVTLAPFWIDKYEVTIEQYTKYMSLCMNEGSCWQIDLSYNPSLVDDPQKPQVGVPWYDAHRFCSIRNARLPSEEEWEYAASGPENFPFPWGRHFEPSNVDLDKTYPIGTKEGNVSWVGVYDMAGNAGEWVDDQFAPYVYPSLYWPEDIGNEAQRVVRGGHWQGYSLSITTYTREGVHAGSGDDYVGFRCARTHMLK
jgi:formylglycine-generating enzyme required for sulfatase activity